jgi:hypothetical protein
VSVYTLKKLLKGGEIPANVLSRAHEIGLVKPAASDRGDFALARQSHLAFIERDMAPDAGTVIASARWRGLIG